MPPLLFVQRITQQLRPLHDCRPMERFREATRSLQLRKVMVFGQTPCRLPPLYLSRCFFCLLRIIREIEISNLGYRRTVLHKVARCCLCCDPDTDVWRQSVGLLEVGSFASSNVLKCTLVYKCDSPTLMSLT